MTDKSSTFNVMVNGKSFDISPETAQALDVLEKESSIEPAVTHFHVVENEKNYHAQVISVDKRTKTYQIKINGTLYTTKVNDKYDRLIDQLGMTIGANQKAGDVKAPMPGLVLDIAVVEGQSVEKGDKILILEAMKMENIIKAQGSGTVKSIHVGKGVAVEKGQLLVEIE